MKILNKKNKAKLAAAIVTGIMLAPVLVSAGEGHSSHQGAGHEGGDHMMDKKKMIEAKGTGRINKIMAAHNMVNISHKAIAELNWPKMRMNFTTSDQVKLDTLKPGQEVNFTIQVDKDNNYLVTEIKVVN